MLFTTDKPILNEQYQYLINPIIIGTDTIDDGSEDYSPIFLNHHAYHRIKVVYQNHQRLPAARNNGVKNSVGEFITLDSDDEIAKDILNSG